MKKKNLLKDLLVFSMLVILLTSISSCAYKDNKIDDNDGSILITDSLGNSFAINEPPKSVVILESSFASIYKIAGGTYKGIPDNFEDYDLSLEGAINIGDYKTPNKELILACNPDLIIYSTKSSLEGHKAVVEELSSLNLGINFYGVDINSFEDYLYTLEQFTKITGDSKAYQKYGLDIKEEINNIVSKVPSDSNKKVLFIRARSNAYDVISSDNFVVSMLENLGTTNIGENVVALKDSARIINEEYILEYNPDYIFIVYMGTATNKIENNLKSSLYDKEFYPLLNAVKNDKVYILDKKLFNNKPNEKWAQAYQILFDYLYE